MDICKAEVLKSETLPECTNDSLTPDGFTGPFVAKIPVVLAEPVIQIDLEAEIKLEEPAFEIKRIRKNLFITQCKLVDTGYECGREKAGKLFLSGFVRKNIEYATIDCKSTCNSGVSGEIHHTTVKVPFRCVTKVKFSTPPKFCEKGYTKEMSPFLGEIKGHDFCGEKIIGQDPCEMNLQNIECFNEKVFCELEEARFFENDTLMDSKCSEYGCKEEYTFDTIVEKMVVFVRIKLLQNQQVSINGKNYCKDFKR